MASGTFMSPDQKAKREADLERMRARWRERRTVKHQRKARAKINSANASGPHPWARSPVTLIIEGLKPGESVWIESNSRNVAKCARTAKKKVVTRTAFKNGVQGVRVTVVKKRVAKKKSVVLDA